MILFLGNYLHVKNLRHKLIPSGDIGDQRMLKADLMRSLTGITQPKLVVSDATVA